MSEESKSNSDWKKRELGALWKREGKQQNFLSGLIKFGEFGLEKELKVVVFTNKGKAKNERAPDFIIYEDKPRDVPQKESPAPAPSPAEDEDVPSGF